MGNRVDDLHPDLFLQFVHAADVPKVDFRSFDTGHHGSRRIDRVRHAGHATDNGNALEQLLLKLAIGQLGIERHRLAIAAPGCVRFALGEEHSRVE